jgi:hypothetical protein
MTGLARILAPPNPTPMTGVPAPIPKIKTTSAKHEQHGTKRNGTKRKNEPLDALIGSGIGLSSVNSHNISIVDRKVLRETGSPCRSIRIWERRVAIR